MYKAKIVQGKVRGYYLREELSFNTKSDGNITIRKKKRGKVEEIVMTKTFGRMAE